MNPLKTLLSQNSLQDLFRRMETYSSRYSDGKMLACLARLAYFCGLKKGELLSLRIVDVIKAEGGTVQLAVGKSKIPIHNSLQGLLQEYLKYLKGKGYQLSRTSPLFPAPIKKTIKAGGPVAGEKYPPWKLQRDLKKAAPEIKGHNILDHLRQAGIYDFYAEISKTKNAQESLEAAMKFARCKTEKYILQILNSHRDAPPIGNLRKVSRLQRMFNGLSDPRISDEQRIQMAERFFRAVDREKKIDQPRKEDLKQRATRILASKGISRNSQSPTG
jgi:hypothetical protein